VSPARSEVDPANFEVSRGKSGMQSLSSRIVAVLVYLVFGGLVLVAYTFVFVGVIFDHWL
jgi:hypothetical protein